MERLDADLFVQVLSPHGGAFRLRTGACGPYCGSVRRQHSKSELVRSLLQTTNYTPFEIAESDTPRGAGGLMSWAVSKTADPWG